MEIECKRSSKDDNGLFSETSSEMSEQNGGAWPDVGLGKNVGWEPVELRCGRTGVFPGSAGTQ